MREWIFGGIGLLIGLVGGFAAGYFTRKHGEIQIEEVTEEELNELAGIKPNEEEPAKEVKADVTIEAKDIQKAIDTQKTKYWNMWKDGQDYLKQSELADGEDPVISDDETYDIPDDDLGEDNDEEKEESKIEMSTLEEYNYWKAFKDGEYETSDIVWFSGDDVTLDDDTLPIVNPLRHLGFLPKRIFAEHPKEDEVFVKNNFYKIIFCVNRYDQTYDTKRHEEEYGGDDE